MTMTTKRARIFARTLGVLAAVRHDTWVDSGARVVSQRAYTWEGHVMVPAQALFQYFTIPYQWDSESQTLSLQ